MMMGKFHAPLQEQSCNVQKGLSSCISLASILAPLISFGEAVVVVSLSWSQMIKI